MLKLTTAHCSHAGARSSNQDALGMRIRSNDACFVLSDGVGGETGGGHAARLAIYSALQQFEARQNAGLEATVRSCISAAQSAILADQQRHPDRARMAATLIALFIDGHQAQWAHAGDSRLYHFRRGVLLQRTQDHSLVAQLEAAGLPHQHINPNLLSHALGRTDSPLAAPAQTQTLEDGDCFLLCTDGFWHGLKDRELERQLQLAANVQDWLDQLAWQVQLRGEQDNYSAIAVWVGEPEAVTVARVV